MVENILDYPKMMERAMRGVIREALSQVVVDGLPGEHHFYITFDTQADDVEISKVLRAQHPEEMTIVLQHKYWELEVTDAGFGVSLSFGGARQHLYIPFEAVTGFADPSVNFGFKFDAADETMLVPADTEANGTDDDATEDPPAEPPPEGAEVVALDTFRKK